MRTQLANSIWHITNALKSIEECKDFFKKYTETGDKSYWNNYAVMTGFSINYAKIYDERLTPNLHIPDRLMEFHNNLDKYHDCDLPRTPKQLKKVIRILNALHKATLKFLSIEIKRYKLNQKIVTTANLEQLAIKILDYDSSTDRENLVPYFCKLTRELLIEL